MPLLDALVRLVVTLELHPFGALALLLLGVMLCVLVALLR